MQSFSDENWIIDRWRFVQSFPKQSEYPIQSNLPQETRDKTQCQDGVEVRTVKNLIAYIIRDASYGRHLTNETPVVSELETYNSNPATFIQHQVTRNQYSEIPWPFGDNCVCTFLNLLEYFAQISFLTWAGLADSADLIPPCSEQIKSLYSCWVIAVFRF